MVKSNEVRVGNYLKFIVEKNIVKISGSSNDGDKDWIYLIKSEHLYQDVSTHIFEPYLSLHFEPIPLTPEILEKAGFEKGKTQSFGYYGYSNGIVTLDNNFALGLYDGRMDDPSTKEYYPETKYLHQLQNLYHALTGEELQIEL